MQWRIRLRKLLFWASLQIIYSVNFTKTAIRIDLSQFSTSSFYVTTVLFPCITVQLRTLFLSSRRRPHNHFFPSHQNPDSSKYPKSAISFEFLRYSNYYFSVTKGLINSIDDSADSRTFVQADSIWKIFF